jgi:hypothetical protein
VLGQRLDAARGRIEEMAGRLQDPDAKKLKVLAGIMRKIAVRWANLYHNELTQAVQKVAELEKEVEDLKNGS